MQVLKKTAAAFLLLTTVTGCTTPVGPAITLSAETSQLFTYYLDFMTSGEQGAFAVSPDGRYGFYAYCSGDGRCGDSELKGMALNGCKQRARADCVVLARDKTIYRQYVAPGGAST